MSSCLPGNSRLGHDEWILDNDPQCKTHLKKMSWGRIFSLKQEELGCIEMGKKQNWKLWVILMVDSWNGCLSTATGKILELLESRTTLHSQPHLGFLAIKLNCCKLFSQIFSTQSLNLILKTVFRFLNLLPTHGAFHAALKTKQSSILCLALWCFFSLYMCVLGFCVCKYMDIHALPTYIKV